MPGAASSTPRSADAAPLVPRRASSPAARAVAAAVAALCALGGLWLAAQHPLSPVAALCGFAAALAVFVAWPSAWLVLVPALLPWLGLAPWTGWISFEEFDLLLLAAAAAGHGRWALRPPPLTLAPMPALASLWLLAWAGVVALATWRGVADAGGWGFDLYEGYRGPMNPLRLAKPTLALLLLLPLWQRAQANRVTAWPAADRLTLGLALGHLGAALACVWERFAYVGLLNFSSDYRTTGSFWEMHVGGAALDGFLALTLPFALRLLWLARGGLAWGLAAGIVAIGAYAALTTFSRILLLALPLGAVLMLVLQARGQGWTGSAAPAARAHGGAAAGQRSGLTGSAAVPTVAPWLAALLLCGGLLLLAGWLFPVAGYRGLLALLGVAALLLLLGPQVGALRPGHWLSAGAMALVACAVAVPAAALLPKGPYLVDGLALLAGAVLALAARGRGAWLPGAVAAYAVAAAGAALVAWHWGGQDGLLRAAPAAVTLLLALPGCAALRPTPWPVSLRWQGGTWLAMVVVAAMVGVFGGGSYFSGRLTTVDNDQQGRVEHWRASLARLDGASWWLGHGLGRYLDWYVMDTTQPERAGDLRLAEADGATVMRIAGGHFDRGWGELLRLSQYVARPLGAATVHLTLRTPATAKVHVEVCTKHLIYFVECRLAEAEVKPTAAEAGQAGGWSTVHLPLPGGPLRAGPWYAPRTTVFSVGTVSVNQLVEVRALSLTDADGTELLANRQFERRGARWFFSSDRHHMPWHAKNMAVHLLFEQGLVGLAVLLLATVAALFRLALGGARQHPLAPALAGALLGFWVVGMVDSLLDMPRVATLGLLLTGVALTLRTPPAPGHTASGGMHRPG